MGDFTMWMPIGGFIIGIIIYVTGYLWGHHVGTHKGKDWGAAEMYVKMMRTTFRFIALTAREMDQEENYDPGHIFALEYLEYNPPRED